MDIYLSDEEAQSFAKVKMEDFTLNITLRQETPILLDAKHADYFIRDTELKPRLHRYIIDRLKNEKSDSSRGFSNKDFIIKAENNNAQDILDIVISAPIITNSTTSFEIEAKRKHYQFEDHKVKWLNQPSIFRKIKDGDRLEISISSSKDNAHQFLKHIQPFVIDFFLMNSLGKATDKGFGQFMVEQMSLADETIHPFGENKLSVIERLQKATEYSNTYDLKGAKIVRAYKFNHSYVPIDTGNAKRIYQSISNFTKGIYGRLKGGISHGSYLLPTEYHLFKSNIGKQYDLELNKTRAIKRNREIIRHDKYDEFKKTINSIFTFTVTENTSNNKRYTNLTYSKSLLLLYFNRERDEENSYSWEKEAMKQFFRLIQVKAFGNDSSIELSKCLSSKKPSSKPKYFPNTMDGIKEIDDKLGKTLFIRSILGLAENYEFQLFRPRNAKASVSVNSDNIEQFASPLIFKFIRGEVYLLLKECHPIFKEEQTFKFSISKIKDNHNNFDFFLNPQINVNKLKNIFMDEKSIGFHIKAPTDFNIIDFFENFTIDELNCKIVDYLGLESANTKTNRK